MPHNRKWGQQDNGKGMLQQKWWATHTHHTLNPAHHSLWLHWLIAALALQALDFRRSSFLCVTRLDKLTELELYFFRGVKDREKDVTVVTKYSHFSSWTLLEVVFKTLNISKVSCCLLSSCTYTAHEMETRHRWLFQYCSLYNIVHPTLKKKTGCRLILWT